MQNLSAPRASRRNVARTPSRSTTISCPVPAACSRIRCLPPRSPRGSGSRPGRLPGSGSSRAAKPIVPTAAVTAAVIAGQFAIINGAITITVLIAGSPFCIDPPPRVFEQTDPQLDLAAAFLGNLAGCSGCRPCVRRPRFAGDSALRSSSAIAAPFSPSPRKRRRVQVACRLKASNSPEMIASSISAPLKPSLSRASAVQVELRRVALPLRQVDAKNLAPLLLVGQVDEEDLVDAALCGAVPAAGG